MHSELEQSLQSVQDRLNITSSELEQQKILNEKLENDLLSVNKHKPNGDMIPPESGSLDSLDLGKKSTVQYSSLPSDLVTYAVQGLDNSTDTLHVICRYLHPTYCHQSARSI
jgi:homeobox protein cut-like